MCEPIARGDDDGARPSKTTPSWRPTTNDEESPDRPTRPYQVVEVVVISICQICLPLYIARAIWECQYSSRLDFLFDTSSRRGQIDVDQICISSKASQHQTKSIIADKKV